nr:SLC13 family permease [Pseudomonas aeruginosa]
MLTLLAFAMVATFMFLIMTKRLSALIALILVPIAFALIGGFAAGLGPMMLDGIRTLAPTGVMLMFAILYFAIMIDSGLFDPAVRKILRLVKGDPLKVSLGTAALAMIVSLDGDGSTTYMICVAAVLPLYSRLGMSPLVMKKRIGAHAENILAVVSLIFAAGVFTGILSGTGMVDAMSKSLLAVIPPALGPYLATITALVSMPFTFFMSNDAFYYGVLPILTQAAAEYGITPVEMARASIVGQPVHLLSPLVPSTYLLVGLAKIDFGDHQRFTLKWAVLVCLAILAMALLLGLFPLFSN